MASVIVTSEVTLASSAEDVWPLITDTDRTNRLIGGRPVTYRPVEGGAATATGARFVGETNAGGFALAYEEQPFEWTLHKSFSVHRRMLGGPLTAYTFGIRLEPTSDGGTRATVRLELAPRHWLLRPVAQIEGRKFVRNFAKLASMIDAHVRDNAPSPYLEPASEPDAARISWGRAALLERGLAEPVVDAVAELLASGADSDVVRMRPFELAERWGTDKVETLRVFLHAVGAGLVELRWALVCPSCRTANDQVETLAELGDESHCQLCDISYGIDLDRAVEATFAVHSAVREVPTRMFCIGGPARTPHVLAQANVEVGQARDVACPEEPGRYRVFVRGGALASLEVEAGAPERAEIRVTAADALSPAELRIAPGGVVHVMNETDEGRHVKVERLGYASLAATAHVVTLMGEFRRLFSREILKPSTPLKVARCAVLFSDLTGSTALYTHAGDAAAFRLVDDHFDLLRSIIEAAGGTIVKTMGDAVMASFSDAITCARAAFECQRRFDAFRREHEHGAETGLKLGLFAGPCYVVTANGTIDYFGQTVNCAARVQHLAQSGEIVLEQDVLAQLPPALRAEVDELERFETTVKGVAAPLRLSRVALAEVRASARPGGSDAAT